MNKGEINILMTGAGAPGAAGIIKCLSKEPCFNIIAADADAGATGRYLVDDFVVIPRGNDPAFVTSILDLCRKKNIHVVLPLVTRELFPLASHRDEFDLAGAKVLVSPSESIEIANDKSRLYQFLEWRGIPVPEFRIVENPEQLNTACAELGYPQKTLTIKPSVSNGSRGFRIISEQVDRLDLLLNHKPGHSYTTLPELIAIMGVNKIPEMLVSEYLPGDEYSVDCLCKEGHATLVVPRRRVAMVNGISVKGEFVRHQEIIKYCTDIVRELRLHGNVGVQVKASATGAFRILEINPRVQGTISAALGAGINLPVLAIKSELGLPINEDERQVKWGTRFGRFWEEVYY
jgi:carbamoyl-phosphate synthase large subunit